MCETDSSGVGIRSISSPDTRLRVWASRRHRVTLWKSPMGGVPNPFPASPRGTAPAPPSGTGVMNRVVSAVRRWFARWQATASHRWRSRSRGQPSLTPVLLASERDDDYQTLQALLQNTKWSVARRMSWSEVSSFCDRVVNPVVLRGPALSRLGLAVHGFIASQSCGEPLSDLTFGRLRPVLVERIGAARRVRRSRAAIRTLRGAPNSGFCAKALRSRLAAFALASGEGRLAYRKV